MIGDERLTRLLAVLDLDDDWSLRAPGEEFLPASSQVPGAAEPQLEAFRQKGKHIEHGGLAAAVGAEKDRQRCKVPELDPPQGAEILHSQVFDARGSGGGGSGRVHFSSLLHEEV